MPNYFLPIWVVDASKNSPIMESIFKDFFKKFITMGVDLENI